MDRGSLVERVRRLLALADTDRNPSENEAEAAARLATKLMLENKIEMAEVKRSDFDDYLILGCRAGRKNIPRWRRRLLQVLANYNFCEVLTFAGAGARHKFGGTIFLVGHKDDAQVVRLIHDHVLTQINILRKRALQHLHPIQVKVWNEAFYMGIVDGIYLALRDQRYRAEQNETTMAIVKHADAKTREFLEKEVGDLKRKKDPPKEVKDFNAYIAGRVAADMVEIGTGKKPQSRGRYLEEKADG
jgi:hypothetical protein